MNRILTVVTILFFVLIGFYLTRINYQEPLFSEGNQPYVISSMIALVGALVSLIFINLNNLKKPKNSSLVKDSATVNNDDSSAENS